jgi:hypothetical protein
MYALTPKHKSQQISWHAGGHALDPWLRCSLRRFSFSAKSSEHNFISEFTAAAAAAAA